jgi:4-carboxymuconolactone decarboxylase
MTDHDDTGADDAGSTIDPDRLARGAAMFDEVYGGVMSAPPAGLLDYADLMLGQLFAETWDRPQLGRRERRLLTLASIAAVGDPGTWAIHLEAALRNGELTPTEARECVIHLTAYLGYPRTSPLLITTEEVIGKVGASPD